MNIFPALTFLHVAGAIAIFISWALEYNYLTSMRPALMADNEDAALQEMKQYKKIGSVGVLITLTTGIWLMVALWAYKSWIMMSIISIVLLIITEVLFSRKAASSKTDRFRSMSCQISSIRLRIAIGIGIVALMVFKTSDLLSSISIVIIFLIAGAVWIAPLLRKSAFA
jgi:uncharacterized membrane protein